MSAMLGKIDEKTFQNLPKKLPSTQRYNQHFNNFKIVKNVGGTK